MTRAARQRWRWILLQKGQGDWLVEIIKQRQRRRVVVTEAGPQLIGQARALRHQIAVGADRQPQLHDDLALPRQPPVAVAVGPQDMGKDHGVPGIIFGATGLVTIPVAIDRLWVDRVDGITPIEQTGDEQAVRPLDGNLHRLRLGAYLAQALSQGGQSVHGVRDAKCGELFRLFARDKHVVVG